MLRKLVALWIVASLIVVWPSPAFCTVKEEWGGFVFRYQSRPTLPDSCVDPPDVAVTAIEGKLKIVFEQERSVAQGDKGLVGFTLRLPLVNKPTDGRIHYRGRLQVTLFRIPSPLKYEATLTGRLAPTGFQMVVRYRPENSRECWKERELNGHEQR